jgi:hypothetical protein
MKYLVEFMEKAVVRRRVQCVIEADSEEEVASLAEDGDYEFIDSWEDDDMGSVEFLGVETVDEYNEED